MANIPEADVKSGPSCRSSRDVPALTKPKRIGRPKLPKGVARGKIVPIRFAPDEVKAITAAAKASKQSVSEWTRGMLVDFHLTEQDWNKVISLFGKARDGFDKMGKYEKAKECDDAIALVQEIGVVFGPEQ
jgi:hypothetical protein